MFWIIFLGTTLLSLAAAAAVRSAYAKWSDVEVHSGLTGAQAAQQILASSGIRDVDIVSIPGELTDHYDPMNKRLVLSEQNYYGRSVAAIGVSAHECGHAIQHAEAYKPLHLRMAAVGITQFASSWLLFLPMIGAMFSIVPWNFAIALIALGWGIMMLFNLITLPVEFDATARAKRILAQSGMVLPSEAQGVNAVLGAAAWTYVAAFITSFAWLMMYVLPLLGGNEE